MCVCVCVCVCVVAPLSWSHLGLACVRVCMCVCCGSLVLITPEFSMCACVCVCMCVCRGSLVLIIPGFSMLTCVFACVCVCVAYWAHHISPHNYIKYFFFRVNLNRIYAHRIWPYIWWFPCQKYRIYTVYIWFWPTLFFLVSRGVLRHPVPKWLLFLD